MAVPLEKAGQADLCIPAILTVSETTPLKFDEKPAAAYLAVHDSRSTMSVDVN